MNDQCSAASRSPQPRLIFANIHYFLEGPTEARSFLMLQCPPVLGENGVAAITRNPKCRHHFMSCNETEFFVMLQWNSCLGFKEVWSLEKGRLRLPCSLVNWQEAAMRRQLISVSSEVLGCKAAASGCTVGSLNCILGRISLRRQWSFPDSMIPPRWKPAPGVTGH